MSWVSENFSVSFTNHVFIAFQDLHEISLFINKYARNVVPLIIFHTYSQNVCQLMICHSGNC